MRKLIGLTLALMALTLAACGGGGASGPDADRGKQLFDAATIGTASAPGCNTCHNVTGTEVKVGPSLAGIATRAQTEVEGAAYTGSAKTAEDYIKESIKDPNVYVVNGFQPDVMYQNFGKELTDQEVADLTAYLMTLK